MGLLDSSSAADSCARRRRSAAAADLADFMDSRAAFLAQKCIVEFCRVRAGVYWQKLFSEKEFQEALDHSRWRAYPPCYAMVAEMVEGALREAGGHAPARPAGGAREGRPRKLREIPCPRAVRPKASGRTRPTWCASALPPPRPGAPRPVREIPEPLARMVFEAVPIHPDLLTNDYDYIFNFLRMNLLRAHEDLLEPADRAAPSRTNCSAPLVA